MSDPSAPPPVVLPSTLRLSWRFWALWTASAASNLADGCFKLALPLVAAQVTRDPMLVAGVTVLLTLPWLLTSLLVGALVDRSDRRRTSLWAHALRVATLSALAAVLLTGVTPLPLLYVAALFLGTAEVVADTAAGAWLPALVPTPQLERANARLAAAQTVTNEFVGPPLGAALVVAGSALAFGVSGALYGVAFLAVLAIGGSFRPHNRRPQRLSSEVAAGIRWVWHSRLLRALTLMLAVLNFVWSAFTAVAVLFFVAPGPMGLTPVQYGVLLTSIGAGGLLGTVLVAPTLHYLGRRWLIAAGCGGTAALLLAVTVSVNPWLIGGAAVAAGTGSTLLNVGVTALRQRIVPDALLGRVGGAVRTVTYGALVLGAVVAGGVAQRWGVRAVFGGSALLVLLLVIPFLHELTPAALHNVETADT